MSSNSDPATLEFYGRTAPAYVARGEGIVSNHLSDFLQRLAPNAKVLELGCGGGSDAVAMIAAGHSVDATDGTPEMAKLAEKRLGQPVRVMRFDELRAVEIYDAVWANVSLLHVPRSALSAVLTSIRDALKPGGYFHATYKTGEAEGRDHLGRYFNFLSPALAAEYYACSGEWDLLSITEYVSPSWHNDRIDPWIAVLARKRRC